MIPSIRHKHKYTTPSPPPSLRNIPVLVKQIVEHAQRRLQVHVDNVLGTCLGLRQAHVLHQFKGEADVVHHLVGVLGRQMKVVQGHEEAAENAHQNAEVHAVPKVRAQVLDLKVQLVEVLVDERDQGPLNDRQLVRRLIEQRVEGVWLAAHAHVVVGGRQLLVVGPEIQFWLFEGATLLLIKQNHSLCVKVDSVLLHNHHGHMNVLRQANGSAEVTRQSDQQVDNGHEVL